jgi:hypothetical protein
MAPLTPGQFRVLFYTSSWRDNDAVCRSASKQNAENRHEQSSQCEFYTGPPELKLLFVFEEPSVLEEAGFGALAPSNRGVSAPG